MVMVPPSPRTTDPKYVWCSDWKLDFKFMQNGMYGMMMENSIFKFMKVECLVQGLRIQV
jgi:hypothetical protein